jgi:hypothetical protein
MTAQTSRRRVQTSKNREDVNEQAPQTVDCKPIPQTPGESKEAKQMSGDVALVSALERVAGALERLASSLEVSKTAGNGNRAVPPRVETPKPPSLTVETVRERLVESYGLTEGKTIELTA